MSTCARCGLPNGDDEESTKRCQISSYEDMVACRDRELANLRSLLRSVTGKLEEAAGLLQMDHDDGKDGESCREVQQLIESVLEVLS